MAKPIVATDDVATSRTEIKINERRRANSVSLTNRVKRPVGRHAAFTGLENEG